MRSPQGRVGFPTVREVHHSGSGHRRRHGRHARAVAGRAPARLIASATADHAPFASPQTGWAEQDPDDWWRACQEAIRAVLAESGVAADAIAAVGLSGQMHGAVLLDAASDVLRPAIIWCDQRTEAECHWLNETIGAQRLLELTSNPALTEFTLPKLLWVRAHEPDVWRASARAPAEGLRPLPAERRARHRRRRRVGDADARRRAAPLVAARCSTPLASTRALPAGLRVAGDLRARLARGAPR